MVISSLIGVDWTTPVTSLDEYDVQCLEGANGTDGILEAKDGISYSGKIPQERASVVVCGTMTYAKWIPDISVTVT